MPEQVITFRDGLTKGLRAEDFNPRNTQALTECKNLRVTPGGLVPYIELTNTINSLPTPVVPFPQILKGKNIVLVVDKGAIYELDVSTGNLTQIDTYTEFPTVESVSNGAFDDGTDWTLGANWSIGSGTLTHSAGSTGTVSQPSGDQADTLVLSEYYLVSYTISSYSAGSVSISTGSSGTPTSNSADGYYEEVLQCLGSTTIVITPTSSFVGSIDNISIMKLTAKAITEDLATWQFAEGDGGWVLVNARNTIYNLGSGLTNQALERQSDLVTVCRTDYVFAATCWHQGRLLLAGVGGDPMYLGVPDAWHAAWKAMFDTYTGEWPEGLERQSPLQENMVCWSTIGTMDILLLMLADPQVTGHISGTHDSGNPLWLDLVRRNELGWRDFGYTGFLGKLLPLGNGVMCYGAHGLTWMYPISDPYPGYGMHYLGQIGALYRGLVGGDISTHLFVDTDYVLWRIDAGNPPTLKRLGYREQMVDALSSTILGNITYDDLKQDFYIASDSTGFLLSRDGGLSEINQRITSIARFHGNLDFDSITAISQDIADNTVEVVTDIIDMESRYIKTITQIDVGATDGSDTLKVAVSYRFDKDEAFSTTVFTSLEEWGNAESRVSGVEFKFHLSGDDYTQVEIDYLNIHYSVDMKAHLGLRAYGG